MKLVIGKLYFIDNYVIFFFKPQKGDFNNFDGFYGNWPHKTVKNEFVLYVGKEKVNYATLTKWVYKGKVCYCYLAEGLYKNTMKEIKLINYNYENEKI